MNRSQLLRYFKSNSPESTIQLNFLHTKHTKYEEPKALKEATPISNEALLKALKKQGFKISHTFCNNMCSNFNRHSNDVYLCSYTIPGFEEKLQLEIDFHKESVHYIEVYPPELYRYSLHYKGNYGYNIYTYQGGREFVFYTGSNRVALDYINCWLQWLQDWLELKTTFPKLRKMVEVSGYGVDAFVNNILKTNNINAEVIKKGNYIHLLIPVPNRYQIEVKLSPTADIIKLQSLPDALEIAAKSIECIHDFNIEITGYGNNMTWIDVPNPDRPKATNAPAQNKPTTTSTGTKSGKPTDIYLCAEWLSTLKLKTKAVEASYKNRLRKAYDQYPLTAEELAQLKNGEPDAFHAYLDDWHTWSRTHHFSDTRGVNSDVKSILKGYVAFLKSL